MNIRTFFKVAASLAICCVLAPSTTYADETVTVDPGQAWEGFMNVFEIDRAGATPAPGAFVFGSGWGLADLTAEFSGAELILGPNSIADPDEFWYEGGGAPGALGNKWMDANAFVNVTDALGGMNVTFEGSVISNTLTDAHTATVFIRDFAPDFSSFNEITAALTPGDFSITLATDPGAGRHVQYGFNFQGENVWVTDRDPFGTVVIAAVPEPASASVLLLAGLGLVARRRR